MGYNHSNDKYENFHTPTFIYQKEKLEKLSKVDSFMPASLCISKSLLDIIFRFVLILE